MQHVQIAIPGWIIMFVTVCAIALFVRLANANRIGLLLFAAVGLGLMFFTYGARHVSHVTSVSSTGDVEIAARIPAPPKPSVVSTASRPKPKKTPKSKSVEAAESPDTAPAVPPVPPEPSTATATVVETTKPSSSDPETQPAASEAPLTLYQGSAKTGRPIEALPGWVTELAGARSGSNSVAFSSDRFASIEEAESQLWGKARNFVSGDLRSRVPDATHWSPSPDLLRSAGLVVERCVERTTIEVGQFVEPMYRVHWKAHLSNEVRSAVADAWRPTVQMGRLKGVAAGFLGMTGALAFLNIIFRAVAARAAARKTTAVA